MPKKAKAVTRKLMNTIHNEMVRRFLPSHERQNERIAHLEKVVRELQTQVVKDVYAAKARHKTEPEATTVTKEDHKIEVRVRNPKKGMGGYFILSYPEQEVLTKGLGFVLHHAVRNTKKANGDDADIVRLMAHVIYSKHIELVSEQLRRTLGDDVIIETRPV
ncbi:hypothetical protein SEA_THUNDERCLAP_81 [Arthrobacter phage Thunderclap]|uniref:Uncharacterized protein n=10 Tax=Amigovirus amigo TaxID=1982100 RepID=A0A0U4B608_9CAUD|nr:hypothetical protein FDH66_gp23 [Arthrobacter phage Amigo]ALY08525.1 hypothetical protein ANANSI_82 [Arthrobacter phage Anansi]ALY09139.1 hypothetical protein GORGEOUS_82 [Arthrobacter phage Gorgeous]ALY10157.1 hypothetical protein RINGS_82 [Arthrobacter phage Rings]ALY10420.1 hypothetical protein SORJUANA_82 [Arthrobacter phage SorJuana]QFG08373.1 hypothetical protein SEA_YEEZUS_82 [Arthrobacter phage Yeezus]QFG13422.1 hypothetical protein SEA_ICHOR_82 [Arthrobacter phage Ichor]QFG13940.